MYMWREWLYKCGPLYLLHWGGNLEDQCKDYVLVFHGLIYCTGPFEFPLFWRGVGVRPLRFPFYPFFEPG